MVNGVVDVSNKLTQNLLLQPSKGRPTISVAITVSFEDAFKLQLNIKLSIKFELLFKLKKSKSNQTQLECNPVKIPSCSSNSITKTTSRNSFTTNTEIKSICTISICFSF